jgi:hypothetical protein
MYPRGISGTGSRRRPVPEMDATSHRRPACLPEIADETAAQARRQAKAQHEQAAAGPGEAAESGTRLPHRFGPAGDQPVEILSLSGRQGERIHVVTRPRRTTPQGQQRVITASQPQPPHAG